MKRGPYSIPGKSSKVRPRWNEEVAPLIMALSKMPLEQQKRLLSVALTNNVEHLEEEETTEDTNGRIVKNVKGFANSLDELLENRGVDLKFWKVARYKMKENRWDVHGKNASNSGWIKATNKQFFIEVTLEPIFSVYDDKRFKQEFMNTLQKNAKQLSDFQNIKRDGVKGGRYMLEINLWDVHMGRFIWNEKTGEIDYNTDIACKRYRDTAYTLFQEGLRLSENRIEQIVIPIGNDYFTSDKDFPFSSTTAGTPQKLDHMWQHIYRKGREALIDVIEMLAQHAPVYIYNIPGNHDAQKSFYLGDAVELYFANHPTVHVDNGERETKYHRYGNSLIGYHHGRYRGQEGFKRLATTMQDQMPKDWSETRFHEWHMGDKHKQEQWRLRDEIDYQGIIFKHMRSLADIDDWETSMNYKRQIGGQAYLWDKEFGKTHIIYENILR